MQIYELSPGNAWRKACSTSSRPFIMIDCQSSGDFTFPLVKKLQFGDGVDLICEKSCTVILSEFCWKSVGDETKGYAAKRILLQFSMMGCD